ncbi:MAG: DUF134 domain-containing protein [Clostridia bacterium]|nr:DUF134 domain-containing protein [Clostridia bacterium]
MPRPKRCRRVCQEPAFLSFAPDQGCGSEEAVLLTIDEYEALRLVDYLKLTHEQCADRMDISRTTVTEIYESARYKVAACLVTGQRLVIAGGHYRLCDGRQPCGHPCRRCYQHECSKGDFTMLIAIPYQNGQIFQHFGHTEQFKLYQVEDGQIVNKMLIPTNGSGHGALAGLLSRLKVDTLICGGIGGGAQAALAEAGIRIYGGVQGDADAAAEALAGGTLTYDPNARCDHHDHEHGHEHTCGDHGCGSHDHTCGEHGCGGHSH